MVHVAMRYAHATLDGLHRFATYHVHVDLLQRHVHIHQYAHQTFDVHLLHVGHAPVQPLVISIVITMDDACRITTRLVPRVRLDTVARTVAPRARTDSCVRTLGMDSVVTYACQVAIARVLRQINAVEMARATLQLANVHVARIPILVTVSRIRSNILDIVALAYLCSHRVPPLAPNAEAVVHVPTMLDAYATPVSVGNSVVRLRVVAYATTTERATRPSQATRR